jgi:hypothetical protein
MGNVFVDHTVCAQCAPLGFEAHIVASKSPLYYRFGHIQPILVSHSLVDREEVDESESWIGRRQIRGHAK